MFQIFYIQLLIAIHCCLYIIDHRFNASILSRHVFVAAREISEASPPSYSYIHTLLMNVRSAVLGYNPIITIPAGATNINVTEIRRSKNYLGKLCGLNNTFYLSLPSSFITKSLTRMKWAQASFSYCRVQCLYIFVAKQKKKGDFGGNQIGESGHRSRYLPHAKRALYHLS